MLCNCDVKSLEVVVAAELSQDKVLCQEIRDKVDIHEVNRDRFNLGTGKPGRLVAKTFKFRLIYGGSAYSYAHDPDFASVGYSQKRWQQIIEEYYDKYRGLARWHQALERQAKETGIISIPSGRYYTFAPTKTPKGEWKWPITKIKNYPVQGFGAELVMLARIGFWYEFKASGLEGEFIQTVHDSLVVDTPSKNVYNISRMLQRAVESVPSMCKKYFNYDFTLPLNSEIMVGPNKKDLKLYEFPSNA